MLKHLNIIVSGEVQDVNYRSTARREALRLGIRGFVHNTPDGHVYLEAEGEENALDEFIKWCRAGSNYSKVKNIHIEEGDAINFLDFKIQY